MMNGRIDSSTILSDLIDGLELDVSTSLQRYSRAVHFEVVEVVV